MKIAKIYYYVQWERFRQHDGLRHKINYANIPPIFLFFDYFLGINQETITSLLRKTSYQDPYFEAERLLILGRDKLAKDLLKKFIDPKCRQTVVHVHIPKSAGTSLNHSLHTHFYRKINLSLPGNNTPHLLRYFFENGLGKVPFLTTSHVPLDSLLEIDHQALMHTKIFFVDRDENSRLLSLRNQLLASLISLKFFNRPFAYFVHLELKSFVNPQFFPTDEQLIQAKKYCLGSYANQKQFIEAVPLRELHFWLNANFGLTLAYVRKNKTFNLARFLPRLPQR